MLDTEKLRILMDRRGCTLSELAKLLELSEKDLKKRLKTGELGLDEAKCIARRLRIEKPENIFFAGQ